MKSGKYVATSRERVKRSTRPRVSAVWLTECVVFALVAEGKAAATRFRCKYIEVSAMFNHKLDDLLVGIIKQMRLKLLVKIFKKQTYSTKHSTNKCQYQYMRLKYK